MGHRRWVMIGNEFESFDDKIKFAKEQIHCILGHNTGSHFHSKFLLKTT